MRKNLLLTTALVAFALPAYAGDYRGQTGGNVELGEKTYTRISGVVVNKHKDIDGLNFTLNKTTANEELIGVFFEGPTEETIISGDVIINANNVTVDDNITGSMISPLKGSWKDVAVGITGKTIVNVTDSAVGESVRGANIGSKGSSLDKQYYTIGDIELNIKDTVVAHQTKRNGNYSD